MSPSTSHHAAAPVPRVPLQWLERHPALCIVLWLLACATSALLAVWLSGR